MFCRKGRLKVKTPVPCHGCISFVDASAPGTPECNKQIDRMPTQRNPQSTPSSEHRKNQQTQQHQHDRIEYDQNDSGRAHQSHHYIRRATVREFLESLDECLRSRFEVLQRGCVGVEIPACRVARDAAKVLRSQGGTRCWGIGWCWCCSSCFLVGVRRGQRCSLLGVGFARVPERDGETCGRTASEDEGCGVHFGCFGGGRCQKSFLAVGCCLV